MPSSTSLEGGSAIKVHDLIHEAEAMRRRFLIARIVMQKFSGATNLLEEMGVK